MDSTDATDAMRSGQARTKRRWPRLGAWLGSAFLVLGAAAIGLVSRVYFGEEVPPFLLEKLPLAHEDLWLFAVQVHVVTTVLALPGCVVLSSPWLLRRSRLLHRWLGRGVGLLLLGAVPTGAYLSLFARGGLPSTVGFLLSGAIVAVGMWLAVTRARAGDVRGHRRAALHVLGQLAVAVVSRSMLMGLESLQVDGDGAYIASLYVPVLAAVVLVEWHVGSSLAALRRTFFARILRPTGRVAGRLTRPVGRLVEEP